MYHHPCVLHIYIWTEPSSVYTHYNMYVLDGMHVCVHMLTYVEGYLKFTLTFFFCIYRLDGQKGHRLVCRSTHTCVCIFYIYTCVCGCVCVVCVYYIYMIYIYVRVCMCVCMYTYTVRIPQRLSFLQYCVRMLYAFNFVF